MKKNRLISCIMVLAMLLTSGVGNLGAWLNSYAQENNLIITDVLNEQPVPTSDNKFLLEQNIEKISDTQLKINLKITGNNNDVNMKSSSIVNTLSDNLEIYSEDIAISGLENLENINHEITSPKDTLTINLGDISSNEINISFEAKIRKSAKSEENIPLNLKAEIEYMLEDSEEEVVSSFPIPKFTLVENVETAESEAEKVESEEEPKVQTLSDDTTSNVETYADGTIPFPITIRDFNADYIFFEINNRLITKEDFGGYGMVENTISEDRKPKINKQAMDNMVNLVYKQLNNIKIPKDFESKSKDEGDLIAASSVFEGKGTFKDAQEFYDACEIDPEISFEDISPTNDKSELRLNTIYRYIYYYVNKLFVDSDGLNSDESIDKDPLILELKDGKYTYTSDTPGSKGFFPIDGKGFGQAFNKSNWGGENHNYHFTLESNSKFWFDPDEAPLTFEFEGDDDVWVYINDQLVVDLGGQHEKRSQSITINKDGYITNSALGNTPNKALTGNIPDENNTYAYSLANTIQDSNGNGYIAKLPGKGMYEFDFFFIERHTTESNFKITTNIKFNPQIVANKEAYINDSKDKYNDTEYAYPGDSIYYKLQVTNNGNIPIDNIEFYDEKLGIRINEDGAYKNDVLIEGEDNDFIIIKEDSSGTYEGNDFSKLETLEASGRISIQSKKHLYDEVKYEDLSEEDQTILNEVEILGKYTDIDNIVKDIEPAKAIVSVKLNPYYLKIRKNVVDNSNNTLDDNTGFTITVSGSDGSRYNVKLNSKGECILKNLKHGVKYTISELPIMNYQLKDITINGTLNSEVTMNSSTNGAIVIVTNIKSNDKWYTDSAITENRITIPITSTNN